MKKNDGTRKGLLAGMHLSPDILNDGVIWMDEIKLCECGCGQPAPIAKGTDRRRGWIKGQPLRFILGHVALVAANKEKLVKANTTHGCWDTPEYVIYRAARSRCTNPKNKRWADYGGRGIKFLFTSFEQFFAELGPRPSPKHSIDRKDNDGHYEPGNVRWATPVQQRANQRRMAA